MNALLLKDGYVLFKQSKLTMIMVLVFLIVGATSGSFYAIIVSIIAVMLPLTTIAYDQMHHWDRFAVALPIPRSMQVTSKYVLSLALLVCSVLLMVVISLIFISLGSTTIEQLMVTVWLQIAAALMFMAINYPIVIKLGFERGRIWYIIITVPLVALGALANSLLSLDERFSRISGHMFVWLLIPIFLVWVSHRISVWFMEHKEF